MSALEFDTTYPKGSDEWLLRRLHARLDAKAELKSGRVSYATRRGRSRLEWMETLWAYFVGDPPLQQVDRERAEDLREFIRMARANYSNVIVSAMLDKITLLGVRTDDDNDADGNDAFRRILDLSGPWLRDAAAYAFVMGSGLVMVGKGEEPDLPVVTAEDPRLCAWITDPLDPSRVLHALKTYTDEDGLKTAHLFTGGRGEERVRVATLDPRAGGGWQWDGARSGPLPVRGFGLPLVPLENAFGLGEFEPHLDVIDRINNTIADRLWTQKIQAFRQRALESTDSDAEQIPEYDAQGNKIDINELFRAAPDALWDLPPGRKMWESTPVDTQNVLAGTRDDVKELASCSKTPLFMFTPDAASGSAEGASSMKEGLEDKCRDRIERFTPAVRRISRHILAYANQPTPKSLSTQWASVERQSMQTRTAAGANAKNAGVPLETILSEILQFPPEVVKRAMDQKVAEMLIDGLSGAVPNQQAPTPPQPVGGNA